jgi:3-hydroxyisobutyrate dehydrogenase-like beta-hydroxyacid dehydrogenase
MSSVALVKRDRIGWAGAGRMGLPMATRLLKAGAEVTVYNRTRSKAEPLAALGATLVDATGKTVSGTRGEIERVLDEAQPKRADTPLEPSDELPF